MSEVLRLLQTLPAAARLASSAQRAAHGDPCALAYLKSEGWAEALELVRPGAGEMGRQVLEQLRGAAEEIGGTLAGDVVDGEYEVLDGEIRAPWDGYVRRLFRQPFGGHVLLGPMGQGKTTLAKKLAWRWRCQHDYRVEVVNLYREDRPAWASTISMRTLIRRMKQLQKYLDSQAELDPGEEWEEEDEEYGDLPAEPPAGRKVIIIDEAGMAISTSAANPGRRAAMAALTQCRHVDWVVLYLGQTASQIPLPILAQTTTWVKQPAGNELSTDRDNPMVRDIWARATEAFRDVRHSPYWGDYPDMRSWAYCDCKSLNGGKGYMGMIPFSPAPEGLEEEEEEEE